MAFSVAKPEQKAAARRMRAEHGKPIKRIAESLGVSVSSVSLWVRDIELSRDQRRRNLSRAAAARSTAWSEKNRARRRGYQDEGREQARRLDPSHSAGCMLYWAEGCKSRNQARLTNSDPHMIHFFRDFLTRWFSVDDHAFRIHLNFYLGNGRSVRDIEDWWLEKLALPRTSLCGHSINALPTSSSGTKRNKLPYGVCSLYVHDTRIVQHVYGAIQEYAGFDEPRWLDGPPRTPRTKVPATKSHST
jgi:transposase-like protein